MKEYDGIRGDLPRADLDVGVSLGNRNLHPRYGRVAIRCRNDTPALGAAQQALLQMDPGNTRNVTDMALACAVTYP